MQNIKYKKGGFSIVLALWVTVLLSSISLYLLEYIVPFSRNVKWLDNYTKAYYNSYRWLEESLYSLANGWLWEEFQQNFWWSADSFAYQTVSSWTLLPAAGEWDSDFDKNWNILWPNTPVHIYLPQWVNWSNTNIYFRVPNFDENTGTREEIDPALASTDIINWQLTASNNVLNSTSSSRIQWSDLCYSDWTCSALNLYSTSGVELNGTSQNVHTFFSNNCWVDYACSLKLSVVNELLWKSAGVSWKHIPYLEYKINFGTQKVPYDKTFIQASWKSYGYRKDMNVWFPLKMINEAFDFTIFQ